MAVLTADGAVLKQSQAPKGGLAREIQEMLDSFAK